MFINDSILNSVGLTDKNIKFIISEDGNFNELVPYGDYHHLVLLYKASLASPPEYCPQCGLSLTDHLYLSGTDSAKYKPNHSAMDQIILSYKKNYKGIKNAFSNPASNGCIEGTNRRIKQTGRTAYGDGNPHNYFFRIRLQLFNRHQIKVNFMVAFHKPN